MPNSKSVKQQNKRAAAQVAVEKAPKKPRQDPLLVGVLDAIRQAEDLPEPCRRMLETAASGSLLTPKDARHEAQDRAAQWIADTIGSVRAKLQEATDSAGVAVAEADGKRGALESKVEEAAVALEARQEASKAKEAALGEASQAILSNEADVAAALKAQAEGNASHEAAKKEKEALEAALEESAQPLKAGACGAEEAKAHVDRLLPLALKAGLDESLTTALPMSGTKALAQRGTFDVMVMDGLETGLRAKASELAGLVSEGAPAAAERAAAAEAAQSSLAAAQERQRTASEELRVAQASEKEAEAAFAAAKTAVASLEPERKALEASSEERRLALENFDSYNVQCFQMLKEKETEAVAAAKKEAALAAPAEAADAATAGA